MLSYLHEFHAGNHADILKHVTLLYVLEYLNKKQKPYSFFDTHAGAALYGIDSEQALKTGEASRGIQRLLMKEKENPSQVPASLKPYLDFVNSWNSKGFYPGSPAMEIAKSYEGSNLFLCELHKKEFEKLSENVAAAKFFRQRDSLKDIQCILHNVSGWSVLKSNVPPALKRGAVLCDPSYEENSDYLDAAKYLGEAHRRWGGATIMLWYPLLMNKADQIDNMKQSIISMVKNRDMHTEILDAVLCVDSEDSHEETSLEQSIGSLKPRLYGSGMLVINPSWGLCQHLQSVLPYLQCVLQNDSNGSWFATII